MLNECLQTPVGFLRTDLDHVRRKPENATEPPAPNGGGFVLTANCPRGKFETRLGEYYIVPFIA